MHRLFVREIMQTSVITISPEELVVDAAQVMEDFNIRRLPVVDDDDFLVGIVTDTDILEAETADSVINSYDPDAPTEWLSVADIMTPDVITIAPDATVGQLAQLFLEHKIGGAPVVEPDARFPKRVHLIGIVTEMDIFQMIADAWERELAAVAH
ncbi:MAG: CBS domain-containing protein [Caldilineaceae bacterium]|nr:CBS domain-containing protein [Caldilineaceae bacterium]MCB0161040.1 CBS domain-containing protein [Caldilineaceae bacterium]MCB9160842.1 CBS domain-containing protein [Caldilineaceae bacterium]